MEERPESLTGKFLPRYVTVYDRIFLGLEMILLILVLYYIIDEGREIYRERLSYFKDVRPASPCAGSHLICPVALVCCPVCCGKRPCQHQAGKASSCRPARAPWPVMPLCPVATDEFSRVLVSLSSQYD